MATINVISNLSNCSSDPISPFSVTTGVATTIKVTADSGYDFSTTTPMLVIKDEFGRTIQKVLTLSGDKMSATINLTALADWEKITLNATATAKQVVGAKITLNLSNCSPEEEVPEKAPYNEPFSITLIAEDGYEFSSVPTMLGYDDFGRPVLPKTDFTISNDKKTASGTIDVLDGWEKVIISGETSVKQVAGAKITLNLTSCSPEEEVPEIAPYNEPFSITLIAAEEHEFSSAPTMMGRNDFGQPVLPKVEMTISPDKKTASGTIDVLDGWVKIEVTGEALPAQVVGGEYGSINVYVVDDNSLEEFSKKRFIKAEVNGEEIAYKEFDLGTLVNRIKRVYVDVPIFSDDVLRCGNFNTGINVKQPEISKITLDFGSVIVPAHNKNTLDYDSEVNVFLPFMGFVKIPTDYVGKSISLVYEINIVTGDGVAKFTYDDIPFQVEKISPSSNVIYRTGYEQGVSVIGSDTWDEMLYYGLDPFVYLKWFDDLNNGRNNDSKTGYIKSFKGFNVFSDVSPISSTEMTVEEQQTIIRLLESGVYIE